MGRRTITMSGGITLFIEGHGDGTARRQVRPSRCPACLRNVTATDQDHQVKIPAGPDVSLAVLGCHVKPGPIQGRGIMTREAGSGASTEARAAHRSFRGHENRSARSRASSCMA